MTPTELNELRGLFPTVTADMIREIDAEIDAEQQAREAAQDTDTAVPYVPAYVPPSRASDVDAYEDAETKVWSRTLSRNVYYYKGSSNPRAERGFADKDTNSVYINVNKEGNKAAVTLVHEYVHTLEGKTKNTSSKEYKALKAAVFKSNAYATYLANKSNRIGISHDEYINSILNRHRRANRPTTRWQAENEAVAYFLQEHLDLDTLIDLARTDYNVFQRMWVQFRRFIARLRGKGAKSTELIKIERLFQRAARAANQQSKANTNATDKANVDITANTAATEAQKDPDTQNASGVVYELGDKKVAKRKKTWYSQFNTEIMRWAYQADRKPGDITIKSRDGEVSALVEATEDGYIILYEANHEEVQRQYELYRQRSSLNGHSYRASLVDRGVHRNSESGENGRVQKGFNRDYRENSNTQHDIGNDHKSLRSGDKKTSEGRNGKKYKPSPGVILSWKDTKYFDALERGDMDTVKRMIDEKAEDEDFVEAEREGRRVFLSIETGKLKAADPIVFDQAGYVIPWSQRFGENDPDVVCSNDDISAAINGGHDARNPRLNRNDEGLTEAEKGKLKEETGWSDEIVDSTRSVEEADIYINADLKEEDINGKKCLIRNDIDMEQKDEFGRTNKERMKNGNAPLTESGEMIELHHMGQKQDSPLAELTTQEHRGKGNDTILHDKQKETEIDRGGFAKVRRQHWESRAEKLKRIGGRLE